MDSKNQSKKIEELEAKRYAAMKAGDVAALGALCSDNLLYSHSMGERDDKKSYLDKVASGIFVYHKVAHPHDRILMLGDAALVTGRMTAHVSVGGQDRHIDNSYLAVWAHEGDDWKFVAYQPTPLPKA